MSQYLQYNDPLKIIWRKGTVDDPYVDKTDSLKILNNQIVLSEMPDEFNHVEISGYTEIYKGSPLSNEFKVNYQNGIVTFNPDKEGETVTATYKGRGQILYPAERIYLHNENPDIIETLQEIIDNGQEAIYAVGGLQGKIDEASTLETSLEGDITTATNIKSDLDTSIGNAETTKTDLDNSIAQANLDQYAYKTELHEHSNTTVLENLSDVSGELQYNGTLISNANHTHDYLALNGGILTGDLKLESSSSVTLWLHADVNNVIESDNPLIKFTQDGFKRESRIGIDNYNHFYIQPAWSGDEYDDIFFKDSEANKFKIWHEGNFNPSTKEDVLSAEQKRNIYTSTVAPTDIDGVDGDIWIMY